MYSVRLKEENIKIMAILDMIIIIIIGTLHGIGFCGAKWIFFPRNNQSDLS